MAEMIDFVVGRFTGFDDELGEVCIEPFNPDAIREVESPAVTYGRQ